MKRLPSPKSRLSKAGSSSASSASLIELLESRIAPAAVATIDLSSLTGANGFKLNGVAGDPGWSVSEAGDINGDGFGDVIIGAPHTNKDSTISGVRVGASYVVFGKAGGFGAALDLSSLDGTNGFKLIGEGRYDQSGFSVSKAGDFNGDGFDDLIVGANQASLGGRSPLAGAAYLIYGKASGFAAAFGLRSNGDVIFGNFDGDFLGGSVSVAGDVNGDGFADLILGVERATANGQTACGESYVIFGRADNSGLQFGPNPENNEGFRILGENAGDHLGFAVSGAGDLNGDGFADLIVGTEFAAANGNTQAGTSYVIFGKANGFQNIALSSLDGVNGFRINGEAAGDRSGWKVSGAGDVNGDGLADLIIGAINADPNGNADAGASYVVFGKTGGFGAALNLSTLNGANGFKINGQAASDVFGASVSGAGDVNGDGFGDLIIGANLADPNGKNKAGSSYVVFGKASGFAAALDLASLTGTNGFKINGANPGDQSGQSVHGAGDVNGDGFADLIIGAPNAGVSYVIFGFDTGAVTHPGGAGAQTLTGTAGAEVFVAGTGGDTMIGNGGADIFHGGEGNDLIAISDLNFRHIDGGTGTNTLRLDGSGLSFDPAAFGDRLHNIDRIDLTGTGDNTLNLNLYRVDGLSEHSNTLIIDGDGGDVANLATGWDRGADQVVGPTTYAVYTQGFSKILVASPVTVHVITPVLSIDDVTQAEGDSDLTAFAFTVHLSTPSTAPVTVYFSTANGTAIAPGDYTAIPATQVNFVPGQTSKTISVDVRGETLYEQEVNETFFVNLTDALRATFGDAQALGTITNDDGTPANVFTIDAKHPFTFLDANHDKVTAKLSGLGSAALTLVGGGADNTDISEIGLTGTDLKSAFSLTVKKDKAAGDGLLRIGEVTVDGALKSFTASAADVTVSGLRATGAMKSITTRDFIGGELFTGGTPADSLALTLGNVITLIETPQTISALKTVAFDGAVSAAAFGTISTSQGSIYGNIASWGAIAKIIVNGFNGNLAAQVTASAIGTISTSHGGIFGDIFTPGPIAKIMVNGDLNGQIRASSFGTVAINGGDLASFFGLVSTADAATLGKTPAIKSLTITNGDINGYVHASGAIGSISVTGKKNAHGGSVTNASISARQIGTFSLTRDFTDSQLVIGQDAGPDTIFGTGDDVFRAGSIGAVKIGCDVNGASLIAAGYGVGGPASILKNLTVGGTADNLSSFSAGVFKTAPKIGKTKIDPTNDPRFQVI